jgi:hypothetical protein
MLSSSSLSPSSSTSTIRYLTLSLLGTLLRQGMLCPLDIIPYLIALQGDVASEERERERERERVS